MIYDCGSRGVADTPYVSLYWACANGLGGLVASKYVSSGVLVIWSNGWMGIDGD